MDKFFQIGHEMANLATLILNHSPGNFVIIM